MALSRKPKKEKQNTIQEDKVTELILKGGSSPDDIATTKKIVSEDEIKFVQLRIPVSHLNNIDDLVKKRPGKLSRHTWIMEAIAEKINRDNQ